MAQHDRIEGTREDVPQANSWEDIPDIRSPDIYSPDIQAVPLNTSEPEPLWQLVGGLGIQLVQRYPLLFWSGIWVIILLAAGIAVTGLMNPDLSTRDPLSSVVEEEAGAVQASASSVEEAMSPIWLFGAIAISCGFGSLLLAQRFKQHPPQLNLIDDLEDLSTSQSNHFPGELADNLTNWPSDVATDFTRPPAISPLALPTEMKSGGDRRIPLGLQSQPTVPFLPGINPPNVTIVPGDRKLPLDDPQQTHAAPGTAPGLEELMTIQQRRKEREP